MVVGCMKATECHRRRIGASEHSCGSVPDVRLDLDIRSTKY